MKIANCIGTILLLSGHHIVAQTPKLLTLNDCYAMAREQYPLTMQQELIEKTTNYTVSNLSKGWFPQCGVYGQATYQSEVTEVPIHIPGMEIPVNDKDQYKIYGEISQVLYDGGLIHNQKKVQSANAEAESKKLEVELYKLKDRVNQLFFGVIILDEQLKQVDLLKLDIQNGIDKTKAALINGTVYKSSLDILKAELLKSEQRKTELLAARKGFLGMLGLFINQTITEQTILERPVEIFISYDIKRQELYWYNSQILALEAQQRLLTAKNLPRFNLFVQGGFGKPALNMLNNELKSYFIGGVRLQWNLSGWYTFKNDIALLDLSRQSVLKQQEVFLFNTKISLQQEGEEILKMQNLLALDTEIISLRENIQQAAAAQLENGIITSGDYLREVNALDAARQNKIIHELQGLMAKYNLQTTTGN